MTGVNKVTLIGNCGKDPEVKHLPSGKVVAKFTLATSEKWKDKTTGEVKEDTQWHNVTFWGKLAEIIEKYVKKGNPLYIEGSIKYRNYEDNGVKKYFTEIEGDAIRLLVKKEDGSLAPPAYDTSQPMAGAKANPVSSAPLEEDDLPF